MPCLCQCSSFDCALIYFYNKYWPPGELKTYNAIRQHYWWPGLCTFFKKNYVSGCGGICQQFKINRTPAKPMFIPTEEAKSTRPFAYCSMDFITDLPPIEHFDSILVVVNQGLTLLRRDYFAAIQNPIQMCKV